MPHNLSIGLNLAQGTSAIGRGYVFTNAEAASLVGRFDIPPSNARKALIDKLVGDLKTANVWSKLDAFYMLASGDQQSALLNWVQDSYNLTAINSPSFVANKGFTGDGVTSYLDTGFNPTTASGAKFTQDSATMGIWSLTNLNNEGASSNDIGSTNAHITRQGVSATGQSTGRVNNGAGVVISPNAYPGDIGWSRTASNVWDGYAGGVDGGGGTDASVAMTNASIRILSVNSGLYGVNQIASAHLGSGLNATEHAALKNARQAYLTGVGAI